MSTELRRSRRLQGLNPGPFPPQKDCPPPYKRSLNRVIQQEQKSSRRCNTFTLVLNTLLTLTLLYYTLCPAAR